MHPGLREVGEQRASGERAEAQARLRSCPLARAERRTSGLRPREVSGLQGGSSGGWGPEKHSEEGGSSRGRPVKWGNERRTQKGLGDKGHFCGMVEGSWIQAAVNFGYRAVLSGSFAVWGAQLEQGCL